MHFLFLVERQYQADVPFHFWFEAEEGLNAMHPNSNLVKDSDQATSKNIHSDRGNGKRIKSLSVYTFCSVSNWVQIQLIL
jgi:hypothetical protein